MEKKPKYGPKYGEVFEADTNSGIFVKLFQSVEELKQGSPVLVESDRFTYYCVVDQIFSKASGTIQAMLGTSLESAVIKDFSPLSSQIFNICKLNCLRKIEKSETRNIFPFDTIPPCFSACVNMRSEVYERIYDVDASSIIGHLRDFPEYKISVDLKNLTETSFGIFGATGSGKSVLQKILLMKIIENKVGNVVVIDPQNEYGILSPDGIPGLKALFPNNVSLMSADRNAQGMDNYFIVNPASLNLGDLLVILRDLSEPMIYALISINKHKGSLSLVEAVNNPPAQVEIHEATQSALRARLNAILTYDFFDETIKNDILGEMKRIVVDKNKSIVISLGRYGNQSNAYFIISALIARVFYDEYSNKKQSKTYPKLIITLEEAHKFMQFPLWANIAREMRKFNMILAIVDQIPGSISSEILSQLNNRFVLKLNQERDIESALQGVDGSSSWMGTIKKFPMPRSLTPPRSCAFVYGSCISIASVIEVLDFFKFIDILKNKQSQFLSTTDMTKKSVI